jgi:putative Holliday junction resolvase
MEIEPDELKTRLEKGERLLGLDLGSKTIGLALSDVMLTVATPMETIKRKKFSRDVERIFTIIDEQNVGALVLGLPKNMDGSEGPRCQSTRQFAKNIMEIRAIDICFWDERLSTMAVTRTLIEADASRKRQGELVDKMAASYILQGLLDKLSRI